MRPKKQEPKHSASNIPLEPEPTKVVSSASKDDPSSRMELRFQNLMSHITEEGLGAVARTESLDEADRGLLKLLLLFPHAFKGDDEARRVLSERNKTLSERRLRERRDVPKFLIGMGDVAASRLGKLAVPPKLPDHDTQNWIYTVTITNNTHLTPTPMTFDEIVLFYKSWNHLGGVVFLVQELVQPGKTVVFTLGGCRFIESYAWGAFGYLDIDGVMTREMVASVPEFDEQGNPMGPAMTPAARNAVEQPIEPCADSYKIGP